METIDYKRTRPRLFGVAYRMTGRTADAEDLVQDAFARYHARAPVGIVSPEAYLVRIVTRLALNRLRGRARAPVDYVGFDLPDLVPTDDQQPDDDRVSYGLTVALQSLGPVERAVFLLRVMYDMDYAEIGAIVARREVACRKIFSRAQARIRVTATGAPLETRTDRLLLSRLIEAVRAGDIAAVCALLGEHVVLLTNAGADQPALPRPLFGREAVARFAIAATRLLPLGCVATLRLANCAPTLVVVADDEPVFALLAEGASDAISRLYAISDRRKLAGFRKAAAAA